MSDALGAPTLFDVTGGRATVTLNRPANRNALSTELVESLRENLGRAIADPSARVVVITGNGPVFCAGADLKERRTVAGDDDELPTFVRIFEDIQTAPKPIVARLNGSALAGGLGLACCCDFVIAPLSAKFGFTEVRIGVAPAIISVVCLPRLRAVDAAELFLTGERIDATEAARVGLITRAVADDQVDEEVGRLVAKLLLGGPRAMAASKELLRRVPAFDSRAEAFRWTSRLSRELFASDEATEGMNAFAQKRLPAWAADASGA